MATPLRVLILEDRPADAELMVHELKRAGFEPDWKRVDTEEKYLASLDPGLDIILADYSMPQFDGLQALTLLQDQGLDIPFIVVTGGFEELAIACMKQGASDYLIKDRLGRLGPAVTQALDEKRLREEKRRAEQAVRESEERYRGIFEGVQDAILVENLTGEIIDVNERACEMFGWSREEFLTKTVFDLLPEGVPVVPSSELASLDMPVEADNLRADGELFPVEVTARLQDIGDEKVVLAVVRDITERKKVEAAEKELMQMKDELIDSVSHELRTPLHSIMGFLELLQKGKVPDPAVRQDFIARAAKEADRLNALVNDLLDVSRLEAGGMKLQMEEVDIGKLVSGTLHSLEGLAAEKDISLKNGSPKSSLVVKADGRRLEQVLINLIENAIKFSEPHRPVLVKREVANESVMVKVIDQGPGIPEGAQSRVFDKFYQADSLVKSAGGGAGLGLYISRKIIEAHGGSIAVESELGVGSTFILTIPLQGV